MVPDHDTKYEENPSSHHGGMYEDEQIERQTDRWTGPVPIFPDSGPVPIFSDPIIMSQGIIKP